MYKHILIPTDGSLLAREAIPRGIALAKLLGAKVTEITVTAPSQVFADTSGTITAAEKCLNSPTRPLSTRPKKNGCDLIVMASHGRRGVLALVLGSETVKVLTHCTIPVLVYR